MFLPSGLQQEQHRSGRPRPTKSRPHTSLGRQRQPVITKLNSTKVAQGKLVPAFIEAMNSMESGAAKIKSNADIDVNVSPSKGKSAASNKTKAKIDNITFSILGKELLDGKKSRPVSSYSSLNRVHKKSRFHMETDHDQDKILASQSNHMALSNGNGGEMTICHGDEDEMEHHRLHLNEPVSAQNVLIKSEKSPISSVLNSNINEKGV